MLRIISSSLHLSSGSDDLFLTLFFIKYISYISQFPKNQMKSLFTVFSKVDYFPITANSEVFYSLYHVSKDYSV